MFEEGNSVVSIFLDFSKAFDCLSHKRLLDELRVYGRHGVVLYWFRSYLTNRQQYITLKNSLSGRRLVFCGAPQGSIFGTLLFIVFIDDFPYFSTFFKFAWRGASQSATNGVHVLQKKKNIRA